MQCKEWRGGLPTLNRFRGSGTLRRLDDPLLLPWGNLALRCAGKGLGRPGALRANFACGLPDSLGSWKGAGRGQWRRKSSHWGTRSAKPWAGGGTIVAPSQARATAFPRVCRVILPQAKAFEPWIVSFPSRGKGGQEPFRTQQGSSLSTPRAIRCVLGILARAGHNSQEPATQLSQHQLWSHPLASISCDRVETQSSYHEDPKGLRLVEA